MLANRNLILTTRRSGLTQIIILIKLLQNAPREACPTREGEGLVRQRRARGLHNRPFS